MSTSNKQDDDHVHDSIVRALLELFEKEGKIIKSHSLQKNVIGAGNNFCSIISKLKLQYEEPDGIIAEKSLVLKIPILSNFYKQLSALNMYRNEILMYSTILPAMYEHSAELDCVVTARAYPLPEDYDTLILDDLNERGYTLMDKKNQLNLEHSIAAVKALAKYHALSVKLFETSEQTINLIKVPPREKPTTKSPNTLFDKFNNTVDTLSLPEHIRDKVKRFQFEHIPEAFDQTMVPSDGFNVLCHGDFWLGNLLFKHDQDGRPSDVKIVDFQMVHWSSPVIDLIEFFVTSVYFDVYHNNRDVLMKCYLQTLNDFLDSLKSNTSPYTKDSLLSDMRNYKLFYLYNLGAYMPAVLNDKEDPFNFSGKDTQIYTSDLYKNALHKWITHLNEENML